MYQYDCHDAKCNFSNLYIGYADNALEERLKYPYPSEDTKFHHEEYNAETLKTSNVRVVYQYNCHGARCNFSNFFIGYTANTLEERL